MVTVIHSNRSLRSALKYNEQKVAQGSAICLAAENYPKDTDQLSFLQKLRRLTLLADLNPGIKFRALHISLNFDPTEKLSGDRLQKITKTFMESFGAGRQPYIMYEHFDAGHPHLHIVTTQTQANGKQLSFYTPGQDKLRKKIQAIEKKFGLLAPGARQQEEDKAIKPGSAQKIQYGRSEILRSMNRILDAVLTHYRFCSLDDLNALLRLYNMTADRCSEGSRTYRNRGLVYRVLDQTGKKIGVPVKASHLKNKPTLDFLDAKFEQNRALRLPLEQRLRTVISWNLRRQALPPGELLKALEKDGIQAVLRKNKEGIVDGITYIDHQGKSVFNGKDLGEEFSFQRIMENYLQGTAAIRIQQDRMQVAEPGSSYESSAAGKIEALQAGSKDNIPEPVTEPGDSDDPIPYGQKRIAAKNKGNRFSV